MNKGAYVVAGFCWASTLAFFAVAMWMAWEHQPHSIFAASVIAIALAIVGAILYEEG